MADSNEKVCPGDCLQCTRVQQLYCVSQSMLELRRGFEVIVETLKSIEVKLDQLKSDGESQPSQVKKGKAPKSSGADNAS